MVKYTLIQICGRCSGPVSKHYADCPIVLVAENERLRAALVDAGASLAAAISLLERGGKKAAASDKMFAVMLDDYRKSLDHARAALAEEKQ